MQLVNYVPGRLVTILDTEKQCFFLPRLKVKGVIYENYKIKVTIECEWIQYEVL